MRISSDRTSGGFSATGTKEISPEEKQEIAKLQSRDQEVRAHEQAHVAAGGQFVRGGASFEYTKGPDGKSYAVGGEVSIDASPVKGNPQATIAKMAIVQKAANAPAQPSGADRSVAAAAASAAVAARQELAKQTAAAGKNGLGGEKSKKNTPADTKLEQIQTQVMGSNTPHQKTDGYSKDATAIQYSEDQIIRSISILA